MFHASKNATLFYFYFYISTDTIGILHNLNPVALDPSICITTIRKAGFCLGIIWDTNWCLTSDKRETSQIQCIERIILPCQAAESLTNGEKLKYTVFQKMPDEVMVALCNEGNILPETVTVSPFNWFDLYHFKEKKNWVNFTGHNTRVQWGL